MLERKGALRGGRCAHRALFVACGVGVRDVSALVPPDFSTAKAGFWILKTRTCSQLWQAQFCKGSRMDSMETRFCKMSQNATMLHQNQLLASVQLQCIYFHIQPFLFTRDASTKSKKRGKEERSSPTRSSTIVAGILKILLPR